MSNFIRVLRNGSLFANRKAAIDGLKAKLADLQDGEICIASYGDNSDWSTAKTVLGVVRVQTVGSETKRSYTIFDNEDIAGIVAKIQELDATVRGNLTADDVLETGKHVGVKVVEADGKLTGVTVVESDIASAAELGTKSDTSAADTAFGRIVKEAEARAKAITNAINALNGTVSATNDGLHVLTGVTQANGKLAEVTEIPLAAVAKTGSAADVATTAIDGDTTHVAVAGTNVSAQITDIAKTLKGITTTQANALKYATVPLTSDEIKLLENASNVKEAYKVISYTGNDYKTATDKQQVGEVIKIYKDASIHKIYLGSEADTINETSGEITTVTPTETNLRLNYAYLNANGTYELVKVPVDSFLRESEFKAGLQVNSGVVSVKVAADSEGFLTVGENGVKISGVQNAIDAAIQGLDATVASKNNENVSVTVTEADGKISGVTVTTTGLALDSEVVKNVRVNNVGATVENNMATVTIDGADIAVADTYTATVYPEQFEAKVGTNHIAAADKIDDALKKTENTISVLATEVISNEKVTTAAVSKLAKSAGVAGADGVIDYQRKTDANYISAATSVHDATVKLDAAIKTVADNINALEGNALTSVVGGNGITVSTKADNSQTVSLKLDEAADNALAVNANGLYLSNVWDCGTY